VRDVATAVLLDTQWGRRIYELPGPVSPACGNAAALATEALG